uniref:A-kinase anchor protein 2 C-terminal domain-containing protein n=1 Tax=Lates calcarifer TaxID=8187 RepID=A0A4W6FT92_LATCA
MATKPVAWQGQGPVNSLDEWVSESWAQGEVGATVSHSSPLQDKKAPRAEPEEDIDVLEPGAQDENLQENRTLSRTEIAESDSGVSTDFSPCGTMEGNTNVSTGTPATAPKETPIEREIRRAIEREHSLRRSRGLPNPPTSPEYVEIPLRKTVLCQSLDSKSERCQGKDRQFAGKKMQHEIHEEVQREEDLVKLGKVPGFYDKGTVRQLREKKQLFEAFQKPSDSTRSKTTSWSSAIDISTLENQEDISSQTSTIGGLKVEKRQSIDLQRPTESGELDPQQVSVALSAGVKVCVEVTKLILLMPTSSHRQCVCVWKPVSVGMCVIFYICGEMMKTP